MQGVVLHRATKSGLATGGDPRAVDVGIAAVEEHVDRSERVLLAESESTECGHADLRSEERETRHQRVGSFGAAELVRCVGHCPNLTGLWPQTRIDIVSRRPLENVGSPDLESVQRIEI